VAASYQTVLQLARRKAAIQIPTAFKLSMTHRASAHGRECEVANDGFVELQFAVHGFGWPAALEKADRPKWVGFEDWWQLKAAARL
jgi:hypothetical protein